MISQLILFPQALWDRRVQQSLWDNMLLCSLFGPLILDIFTSPQPKQTNKQTAGLMWLIQLLLSSGWSARGIGGMVGVEGWCVGFGGWEVGRVGGMGGAIWLRAGGDNRKHVCSAQRRVGLMTRPTVVAPAPGPHVNTGLPFYVRYHPPLCKYMINDYKDNEYLNFILNYSNPGKMSHKAYQTASYKDCRTKSHKTCGKSIIRLCYLMFFVLLFQQ